MISVSKRDEDNLKYKPFLKVSNITVDYCGYSNSNGHSAGAFLINVLVKSLQAHGNLIQQCPVSNYIYLKNYVMDISLFPFFLPLGEYSATSYVYLKNNTNDMYVADATMFCEITNQRGQ